MATKKAKAGKRGRKLNPSSKSGKIRELLKAGEKPMDIAKKLKCAPALVYNVRARATGGGKKAGKKAASTKSRARSGSHGADGLAGILAAVQQSERDRAKMRGALEKIQAVLADVLG